MEEKVGSVITKTKKWISRNRQEEFDSFQIETVKKCKCRRI